MAIPAFIELVRTRQKPGMIVAEVGCWSGESFIEWAPIVQAQGGSCILVDNFHGNPMAVGPHAESKDRRNDVADLLALRAKPFTHVRVLEGDSVDVAAGVPDNSLDICFLDADHRYQHFNRELAAWLPKVRPGGVLCGHDCESFEHNSRHIERDYVDGKHHGVIKAVSEAFEDAQLIADTCWMVVKK